MIEAVRIGDGPIIHAGLHPSLGDNINGPSLVRRPDWAPGPGRYMLYFAHHKGQHIRLAFADDLTGPWWVHAPGVLPLSRTPLAQTRPDRPQPAWARAAGQDGLYPHLASPDLWIDDKARLFGMLFHGLAPHGEQVSYQAVSADGLDWQVTGPEIAETYLRRLEAGGRVYALARGSVLMRAEPGGTFARGPVTISEDVRHVAARVSDGTLHVLFTRIGDAPERICHAAIAMTGDWRGWRAGPVTDVLRPERDWEGARAPVRPSVAGAVGFANELRDPCLFDDEGTLWLVYAGGGEAALGLARLDGLRSRP